MQLIFTPNTEAPFNLIQITPSMALLPKYDNDEFKVIEHVIERNKSTGQIADGAPYWVIDSEEVPTDHYFFEAWEYRDNGVRVNMEKARAIHLKAIRQARNVKLALHDIPFMRAVEDGDQDAIRSISSIKQTLRDIPQTFDLQKNIRTPAELKAAWPEGLLRN